MPYTIWKQEFDPQKQIDKIIKEFMSFRDRIIGYIRGNHENRIWKKTAIDPAWIISMALNIPYLDLGGYIDFKLPNITYKLFAQHGDGNNAKHPLTRFDKLYFNYGHYSDLLITAHQHRFASYQYNDRDDKRCTDRPVLAFENGCFLNGSDYVFKRGYPAQMQGASKLFLNQRTKNWRLEQP